jgi:hypothetical protein
MIVFLINIFFDYLKTKQFYYICVHACLIFSLSAIEQNIQTLQKNKKMKLFYNKSIQKERTVVVIIQQNTPASFFVVDILKVLLKKEVDVFENNRMSGVCCCRKKRFVFFSLNKYIQTVLIMRNVDHLSLRTSLLIVVCSPSLSSLSLRSSFVT